MNSALFGVRRSKNFLLTVVVLQCIFYSVVFLNIPIARQAFGFLYLTFVPGFVLLRLLKLEKLNQLETILFSLGLSIAFLMFAGLSINEIGPLMGILTPLSQVSLMIALNTIVLFLCLLSCFVNKDFVFPHIPQTNLKIVLSALLYFCLPALSVLGANWVNIHHNNSIMLFMIVAISVLFILGVFSTKLLPSKLYPLALIAIAIALLYHCSLISNYIIGWDVHLEYSVSEMTHNNLRWSSVIKYWWDTKYGRFNAMLSVTILPTIYSSLLNIDTTWIFKLLYPLIFSFVPLGLYQIWQTYLDKKSAFISTFLFMAQLTFYTEMLGLARQMVAELFLVLLFLTVFHKKMKSSNKKICFIVFSAALVVSHYSISYVFAFFISTAWIYLVWIKRERSSITLAMIALFFVTLFSWYIYTSNASSFESLLMFGNNVGGELSRFFDLSSRGEDVMKGLGLAVSPSIWNTISRIFAYLTEFFIVVGFVALITGRTKKYFDQEYVAFSTVGIVLLAICIVVPQFAVSLNMTRFYHVTLFILAPFCVLGASMLVKLVSKGVFATKRIQNYTLRLPRELKHLTRALTELKVSILLLAVLIPYFLFQTNFIYEVTGSQSWSIALSKDRMGTSLYSMYGYVDEQNVFGAKWLSKNVDIGNTRIYADMYSGSNVLASYGMIYIGYINWFYNTTKMEANDILYLSRLNVVDGKTADPGAEWNFSQLSFSLNDMNKIYSNGGCEIYQSVVDQT